MRMNILSGWLINSGMHLPIVVPTMSFSLAGAILGLALLASVLVLVALADRPKRSRSGRVARREALHLRKAWTAPGLGRAG
jgi:hypothetical protein